MAIVTRYFGVAAAGTGDGTTWADRAALFTTGNWSSVLTGFDFSGSDSMLALVGPGTYECKQTWDNALFANHPNIACPCTFASCNSSGAANPVVDPGWVSAQPAWDLTGIARIDLPDNIRLFSQDHTHLFNLRITTSATSNSQLSLASASHCVLDYNASGNTGVGSSRSIRNSVLRIFGDSFGTVIDTTTVNVWAHNVRVEFYPATTSGNRYGINARGNSRQHYSRITVIGAQFAFNHANSGAISHITLDRCLCINSVSDAIRLASTITTESASFSGLYISGSGGYALNQGTEGVTISGCRFRNNTSGISNLIGNTPLLDCIVTAGTDADEFVDAANGDYRIKFGSVAWGKGIGAGDEPAPTGGGGLVGRVIGNYKGMIG